MSRFFPFVVAFQLLPTILCYSYDGECIRTVAGILRLAQTGQVLVSEKWLRGQMSRSGEVERLHDIIPWIVYSHSKTEGITPSLRINKTKSLTLHKFASSRFAHLHHLTSFRQDLTQHKTFTWRQLYLTVRLRMRSTFQATSELGKHKGLSASAPPLQILLQKDLFIVSFDSASMSKPQFNALFTPIFKHTIWVGGCKFSRVNYSERVSCIYSTRRQQIFLQNVPTCGGVKSVVKFREQSLGVKSPKNSSKKLADLHAGARRSGGGSHLPRKGLLYNSLVFIAKKTPDNVANAWGPFTVASWLGILAAYTVTAIVFGVIKIVTMNNLDNSWYDCIINQVLSLVQDDKVSPLSPRVKGDSGFVSSSKVGVTVVGLDENDNVRKGSCKSSHLQVGNETRRISVRSLTQDEEGPRRGSMRDERDESEARGKMSKAILYGTIRIVSFILLAMYEGKLYNTITFPKSKFVASFDELISNEKYLIKLSSEAAKLDNLTERISRGGGEIGKILSIGGGGGGLTNKSRNRLVESVNILDCVNWVESGTDPNHACVGYEFELRNLHKAQKSDKILVKSKQRLLRLNSARLGVRRRGFTLFPGGFQISKWILESGILQLWSIVENAFMESLINPNWSDPFKVFTIRDYLGLFVVYSLLLSLATITFCLEHVVVVGKAMWRSERRKGAWKRVRKCWKRVKKRYSYNRVKSNAHIGNQVKGAIQRLRFGKGQEFLGLGSLHRSQSLRGHSWKNSA